MTGQKQKDHAERSSDMKRVKLLLTLAAMPEEAFGWFVAWASGAMVQYPDGLGGFMPNSREAVAALREAANEYGEAE